MAKRKPNDPERSADLPHDWVKRHLLKLEKEATYDPVDIVEWKYRRSRLEGAGQYTPIDNEWKTIRIGETWGGEEITAFFETTLTLPENHRGKETYLDISLDGGECQLSVNGRPYQGLDYYRSLVPFSEFAATSSKVILSMEAFIINYPYDERRGDEKNFHTFERARLIKRDTIIWEFLYDAQFVLDTYLNCWKNDTNPELEAFLLYHLKEVCRTIGPSINDRQEAREASLKARELLRKTVFENSTFRQQGEITYCGHSHLDIVYLWPVKETLRKNSRTATNMLSLMREYPEFRFSSSQPYLFEKLKEMYPSVYDEIRERVKEGRWEVTGAMYVEPDGNTIGTESIVRQLLFGKRFYRKEFGVDTETCWLPDVFGVMHTLPQILRKAGVKYFSSPKLKIWNDTNDFPYEHFLWRSPDGSTVFAHFSPSHFALPCEPEVLFRHWQRTQDKNTIGKSLFIYGYADGGGGPTREMVEANRRAMDFPGLPKGKVSVVDKYLKEAAESAKDLPFWDDELYLEAHRGTYTTKGELKRLNRKAEILYRDAEIINAIGSLFGNGRTQNKLNEGWKLILVNQFHDNLPGTHVPEALLDIRKDAAKIFSIGEDIRTRGLRFLCDNVDSDDHYLLFNTLSWQRSDLASLPIDGTENVRSIRIGGKTKEIQKSGDRVWFVASDIPSMGWITASLSEEAAPESGKTADFADNFIETPLYSVEIDDSGNLLSLFDKRNDREILSAPGNLFRVFEDDPGFKFSAWDIAAHIEEYEYPVRQTTPWEMRENGALFATFTAQWKVLNSTIDLEMRLHREISRIDFNVNVDWRDSRKLLKVTFPVAIKNRRATYDLPFGNIERATHRNTSWEQGKYEVCGHKWADLSEGDYGVALLNDCKYGYDIRDNVMRLSLLRAPVRPDGQSDIGKHIFSYALLPHSGDWRSGGVDRRGYEFNIPVHSAPMGKDRSSRELPESFSFLECNSSSRIVEAIKEPEEGEGIIVRSFDSHGTHEKIEMDFCRKIASAVETNLLEEESGEKAIWQDKTAVLRSSPYEIRTQRLTFK